MDSRPWQESDDSEAHDRSFDFDLAGASTPLKIGGAHLQPPNSNNLFTSPIRKLNELHLSNNNDNESYPDADTDGEEYTEADQTIDDGPPSDVEFKEDEDAILETAPVYLNSKKRTIESPSDMVVTPGTSSFKLHTSSIDTNASVSFKLSFSDSTPCPRQSRKRLKFKDTTPSGTPSGKCKRKNILNFSNSRKTSIQTQLDEATNKSNSDDIKDDNHNKETEAENNYLEDLVACGSTHLNTPISQSTPASSRAPSPPSVEEFGESIDGYKFVKPKTTKVKPTTHPYYTYATPLNKSTLLPRPRYSSELRNSYIRNDFNISDQSKYKIVGELPVENAGLMSEDGDVHVGDKRINDPYLHGLNNKFIPSPDKITPVGKSFKKLYMESSKFPILQLFRNETLSELETLHYLNDTDSVLEFYKTITTKEDLLNFIRKDRIRWHPDKWSGNKNMNKELITALSQTLNALVDNLSQD